ncbi:MAG: endopeptidase La [Candidatus Hydrogenedentota bacterium]|nr:MAG: endopeptidase La [Candidatus Hydrogenedentota bacterium]
MVIPLFVGRERSVEALNAAMKGPRLIFLAAQRDPTTDDPVQDDIFRIGTVSEILQLLKLPDGTIKVLVEGVERRAIRDYLPNDAYFEVLTAPYPDIVEGTVEFAALLRSCVGLFEQYVKLNKRVPPETVMAITNQEDPARVADAIAAQMVLKVKDKQEILETRDLKRRIELIMEKLTAEIEILKIEKKIRSEVRSQMEQTQREYYLNEQMKAIQKELGKKDEDFTEMEELKQKIAAAGMPDEVRVKAERELRRLERMSPMSAEASVCRTYLDWLVELPWKTSTRDRLDIRKAARILDEDHYGLEKAKERILEYLSVRKLSRTHRGPILCFVGPPGVGKTSLGRSIARAIGRKFVRMSLGGVRDEAEIRGHRRTYVGALPGRIIQGMRRAGSINPLFLLDEVDKMAMDFRGDPSAALLEVLDPEQNATFADHYLDVDYNLSQVIFITTANVLYPIPRPLLDRMEVINLSGYTDDEKVEIGKRFLVPKQLEEHGLKKFRITFPDETLYRIIREYTREAGVRNLERSIARTCRKVAREIVEQGEGTGRGKRKKKAGSPGRPEKKRPAPRRIAPEDLKTYLGVPKYRPGTAEKKPEVGVVMGLAWTETGGELLAVEALKMPGTGKLTLTGKLGEVMQESAQAAYGYTRSRAKEFGCPRDFFKKTDVHVHVPEGAIPKDGPSAGITIATALLSLVSNRVVRCDLAMTGEITLRGKVLPIGGLKEKLMAAARAGIDHVIFPKENERDLEDIPESIKKKIQFHPVESMDEVLDLALARKAPSGRARKKKR